MAMVNPYNYKKPVGVITQNPKLEKPNVSSNNVNNNFGNKANDYLEQKILSAKPEELTLMLYDGIVKFLTQTKLFNDQKSIEKSSNANLRAQAIIDELRATLNMDIELSENLESLYIFMNERLIEANINKDNTIIDEVLDLTKDLRDTWKTAMKL